MLDELLPLVIACSRSDLAVGRRRAGTARRWARCVRLTHDGLDKQRPSWSPGRPTAPVRAARARRARTSGSIVLDVENAGVRPAPAHRPQGPGVQRRRSRPTARGCSSPRSRSRGRRATSTSPRSTPTGTGLKTISGDEGKLVAPGLAVVVARRPAVRVQLDPRGQPGDLHRRGRRHRPRSPDPEPRARRPPVLVARRPDDRLRHRPLGRPGARGRPARRHRPGPPDPRAPASTTTRPTPPMARGWRSSPTATASSRSTSPRPTAQDRSTLATPAPRHLPHLDARRPRRHVRLGPRRRVRPLHAGTFSP